MLKAMTYHHGNLRRAMLDATAAEAAKVGVEALSLRALARSLGVTHTAIRHHFADKRGLLTALATEGYEQLAEHLRPIYPDSIEGGRGLRRVDAREPRPLRGDVQARPRQHQGPEPSRRARQDAGGARADRERGRSGGGPAGAVLPACTAAWSIVHGYATLAVSGVFGPFDPAEARETILLLADGMGRPTRS